MVKDIRKWGITARGWESVNVNSEIWHWRQQRFSVLAFGEGDWQVTYLGTRRVLSKHTCFWLCFKITCISFNWQTWRCDFLLFRTLNAVSNCPRSSWRLQQGPFSKAVVFFRSANRFQVTVTFVRALGIEGQHSRLHHRFDNAILKHLVDFLDAGFRLLSEVWGESMLMLEIVQQWNARHGELRCKIVGEAATLG